MKVIDLHCDTLSALRHAGKEGKEKNLAANDQHIDLAKMEKGDYLLQCFAAFVFLKGEEDPFTAALEEIDIFYDAMERYADRIAPVKTWADLEQNRAAGKLSAMLTVEEGGVCKGTTASTRKPPSTSTEARSCSASAMRASRASRWSSGGET